MVFYKELFKFDGLTPNDKIVYSYLAYKSIPRIDGAFQSDGEELDMQMILETLEFDDYILCYKVSYRKLANILKMSPRSVINSLNRIKEADLINGQKIRIPIRLILGGFFNIYYESQLNGELLVFYSYIKTKAQKYGGQIDTFKKKIAEEMNTTKIAITNLLNRLYKLKLVERLPDGKLKIS